MTRAVVAFALTLLTATPLAAAPIVHGPKATVDAVLAAEKTYSDSFANTTIARGMRDFIADDGLVFSGGDPARGPAAAFAAFGGDAPSSARLSWVPAEVFAAASGDMAASWGRFAIVDSAGKAPSFSGHYVTVWHKNASGTWKAIMDVGTPDAPPPPSH